MVIHLTYFPIIGKIYQPCQQQSQLKWLKSTIGGTMCYGVHALINGVIPLGAYSTGLWWQSSSQSHSETLQLNYVAALRRCLITSLLKLRRLLNVAAFWARV